MPSTAIFFASKSSKGKICEQLKILMDHSSPLRIPAAGTSALGYPYTKDFFEILDMKPGQTSSDGSDPKELLSVDHPCHLKNRNAPKYIFMTTRY